jgi:hypothetical protein
MVKHVDTFVDESPSEESREVKVSRYEGEPLGIASFVNAEELERLGIDAEETEKVAVQVEDGFILLFPSDQ